MQDTSSVDKMISFKDYIAEAKSMKRIWHTSAQQFKIDQSRTPVWFAVVKKHAVNGWYENLIDNGSDEAYIYECAFSGNLATDDEARALFEKNKIDYDDYVIDLVENPEASKVLRMAGTRLLVKNGYDALQYMDYDPTDWNKDAPAIIVFNPSKTVKQPKIIKSLS